MVWKLDVYQQNFQDYALYDLPSSLSELQIILWVWGFEEVYNSFK